MKLTTKQMDTLLEVAWALKHDPTEDPRLDPASDESSSAGCVSSYSLRSESVNLSLHTRRWPHDE